jgi:apoptosis-inducing factor 2
VHRDTLVTLVHARGRLLDGDHNPKLGDRALARLRAIGVDVRLGVTVSEPEPGRYVTSAGETIKADMVIWATGTTPNTDWLREHHGWLDETGHVKVDGHLRAGRQSDVFAVGDVNDVPEAKLPSGRAPRGRRRRAASAPSLTERPQRSRTSQRR